MISKQVFLRFDCSAFKNRDATKCHYNKETVEIGKEFHTPEIESSCTIGCYCRGEEGISAAFQCTHIDCPEFLGGRPTVPGKKCIHQYNKNSCCIEKTVCGTWLWLINLASDLKLCDLSGEELTKLAKCEFAGKSYYEGERIDTGRSCYSCLCGKDFEDKPVEENKHCHKINCNMDLHYSDRMRQNCIPIFYKTDDCCPIDWRCPNDKTTVVPDSSRKDGEVSPLKCTFGDLKMSLGDFLSPDNNDDQCTICTCKVPPYPHCIKTCWTAHQ